MHKIKKQPDAIKEVKNNDDKILKIENLIETLAEWLYHHDVRTQHESRLKSRCERASEVYGVNEFWTEVLINKTRKLYAKSVKVRFEYD